MHAFLRGDADVLVSTTITESGLDIPQANTLVVERADALGLAQLYQIRGRVGRSDVLAHAYLFYPDSRELTPEARARLATLADHTELGAGFAIAMRDLEIRGAGDLLGAEALKIDLHRRLALAETDDELRELRAATEDRYGPLPEPVEHLFAIKEAKVKAARLGADYVVFKAGRAAVGPIELGSGELRALRRDVSTAVYTTARKEVTVRGEEFGEALRLVDAILDARQAA